MKPLNYCAFLRKAQVLDSNVKCMLYLFIYFPHFIEIT